MDGHGGDGGVAGFLIPVVALALCCGGPLLFSLLASIGISSAIARGLPLVGGLSLGALLVGGSMVWLFRRRCREADCQSRQSAQEKRLQR